MIEQILDIPVNSSATPLRRVLKDWCTERGFDFDKVLPEIKKEIGLVVETPEAR